MRLYKVAVVYKAFQLFTLLAVANPFCCCASGYLDGIFAGSEATDGCCGNLSSQSNDMDHQKRGHPEKCPHQATKAHQQATQQDIAGGYTVVHLTPLQVAELCVDESLPEQDGSCLQVTPGTASTYFPPGLGQVYCVYRI